MHPKKRKERQKRESEIDFVRAKKKTGKKHLGEKEGIHSQGRQWKIRWKWSKTIAKRKETFGKGWVDQTRKQRKETGGGVKIVQGSLPNTLQRRGRNEQIKSCPRPAHKRMRGNTKGVAKTRKSRPQKRRNR